MPPVKEPVVDPAKFSEKYYRVQDEEGAERDTSFDPIITEALER